MFDLWSYHIDLTQRHFKTEIRPPLTDASLPCGFPASWSGHFARSPGLSMRPPGQLVAALGANVQCPAPPHTNTDAPRSAVKPAPLPASSWTGSCTCPQVQPPWLASRCLWWWYWASPLWPLICSEHSSVFCLRWSCEGPLGPLAAVLFCSAVWVVWLCHCGFRGNIIDVPLRSRILIVCPEFLKDCWILGNLKSG